MLSDYLPGLPKKWKTLVGLLIAYIAFKQIILKKNKNIKNKVAVITGAGSGIGELMAKKLAKEENNSIAILDLNLEGAERVKKEIEDAGGVAKAYKCDVSNITNVREVAQQVLKDFGRCDILINNAGIVSGHKLLDEPDRLTELTVQVNTIGILWLTKAFLPSMIENNSGHIVNIASSAGRVGVNGLVSYCASKFGAVGATDALRGELKSTCPNIKTLCVCPMYIKTGMFKGAQMNSIVPILNPLLTMIMPLLEPQYVADRVIECIKSEQELLVMPRFSYLSTLVKALTSPGEADVILSLLGVTRSMNKFEQTRKN